jgi:hypothetical protein
MSTGDPELDKKLDKLMKKLKGLGKKESENILIPITLESKETHFYWSISHKMFLEVPVPSELYLMPSRGEKEGKCYVFSPWLFNSGAIFLVSKEKVVKIGAN